MNKDRLQGNWKQLKGYIKQKWGKLTDDEVSKMEGRSEELEGLLQEKYGYKKEKAKEEIDAFLKDHDSE